MVFCGRSSAMRVLRIFIRTRQTAHLHFASHLILATALCVAVSLHAIHLLLLSTWGAFAKLIHLNGCSFIGRVFNSLYKSSLFYGSRRAVGERFTQCVREIGILECPIPFAASESERMMRPRSLRGATGPMLRISVTWPMLLG